MVERKLYKTKLCVLYQRGHCPRHNCSFAHGNSELRQSMASRNAGRRDHQGGDLRDKLDQRLSPRPGKNARARRSFHGPSPSRSLEKSNDRKRRKKQQFDGQSDFSGNLKISDRADDRLKERKSASSELKEMQSNINKLESLKSELRKLLEERAAETDNLTSRIQEIEAQLSAEREECKRITSKIKKFVRAYKHYASAQDELKRSEVRFQKLGDQLISGSAMDCNEEDSNINIVNEGEKNGHLAIHMENEMQKQHNTYPTEKTPGAKQDAAEKSTRGNLINGGGNLAGNTRPSKLLQFHSHLAQLNSDTELEVVNNRIEGKQKKGKCVTTNIPLEKGTGSMPHVPSTSMAAHAIDEPVETEMEENVEVVENISVGADKGEATYEARSLPFLTSPPLPVPQNTYSKYEGENEHVDIGDTEEEMEDVDIV